MCVAVVPGDLVAGHVFEAVVAETVLSAMPGEPKRTWWGLLIPLGGFCSLTSMDPCQVETGPLDDNPKGSQ